jgi:small conductance mechanosensitive channel
MLNCGVSYDADLEFVQDLTIKTMAHLFPQNGKEEVEFMFEEFADSSINFVVRFWVNVSK